MKELKTLFVLMLFSSVYLSCTKDKMPPVVLPTAADTISKIIDSVKGSYRVFVTHEIFSLAPCESDTLGFDTIEVLKAGSNSISILNYSLTFEDGQILSGTKFYFFSFPQSLLVSSQTATFFLMNDTIVFTDGYSGPNYYDALFYIGGKISQ